MGAARRDAHRDSELEVQVAVVDGFVEPSSGETYWWIVPRLNWLIFEQVLADFAQAFEVSATNRLLLVLAQASFHTTDKLTLPEGLHLLFLPPRSPELQPAERLWPLTDEAIANRSFASLDELEDITAHRCRVLMTGLSLCAGSRHFTGGWKL